jgi:hypothetical protein
MTSARVVTASIRQALATLRHEKAPHPVKGRGLVRIS